MPFDPALAAFRFGTGLSPRLAPPASEADLVAQLFRPPVRPAGHRSFAAAVEDTTALRAARRAARLAAEGRGDGDMAAGDFELLEAAERKRRLDDYLATLASLAFSPDGLIERLVLFWGDHFTTRAKSPEFRPLVAPYVQDALRSRILGPFEDLLVAAVTHPVMLHYLDQDRSVGPESAYGLRTGQGLNENLAREVMELHTLGVDGPYDQGDVRQLAELLTGLTGVLPPGAAYNRGRSEPGPETVLDRIYRGERPEVVDRALRDLARHPATARHLSAKLVSHFVSDDPDPALVEHVTRAWEQSGGTLAWVMAALIGHPAAWVLERTKVRRPVEFVAAALRALDPDRSRLVALDEGPARRWLERPLAAMGQPWEQPNGPDGWAEEAGAWITPQGLAGRIDWAMRGPTALLPELPDPRDFADAALGPFAGPDVTFAAGAAASRAEGVGLVLASASFNRR